MKVSKPPIIKTTKILLCLLIFLVSCSPLSKPQLKLTQGYYAAITNYADMFQAVNFHVANAHLDAKKVKSMISADTLKYGALISAIQEYELELVVPDSVQSDLDSLNEYVQQYFTLIPSGVNIYQVLKGAGSAIPYVGGAVRAAIPTPSKQVSPKNGRKIIRHINRYESIDQSLLNLQSWIDHEILPEINRIEEESMNDLEELEKRYLFKKDEYDYYIRSQRAITLFYQRIFLTRRMATELSNSISLVIQLDTSVRSQIKERDKTIVIPHEVNELINELRLMRDLSEKINELRARN